MTLLLLLLLAVVVVVVDDDDAEQISIAWIWNEIEIIYFHRIVAMDSSFYSLMGVTLTQKYFAILQSV